MAMEEQFSWMTEADQNMLQSGLEPVPSDHFAEVIGRKGEGQFQANGSVLSTSGLEESDDIVEGSADPGDDSGIRRPGGGFRK
jgi:hypothetical protein